MGSAVAPGGGGVTKGIYAARPLAAVSGEGSLYFGSDTREMYLSDGTIWEPVSGGNEVGYAEISTPYTTTSSSFSDVTGLSFMAMAPERPVVLEFQGHVKNNTGSPQACIFALCVDGVMQQGEKVFFVQNTNYFTAYAKARIAGLTPGVTYTFKLQLRSLPGGAQAEIYGDSTWRSFLRLVAE
jgi:hypothetical protein